MVPFEGMALPSSSPAVGGSKPVEARASGGLGYQARAVAEQRQQVVTECHDLKLPARSSESAEEDAPQASALLHLTEDGFDDGLPHLVEGASFFARDPVTHPLGGGGGGFDGPRRRSG